MKIRSTTKSVLSLAGAAIACSASLHGAAIIYEPFEVGDGTLGGNAGGTGLSGTWNSNSHTTAGSLSYGGLETSGGRQVVNTGTQFNKGQISPGTTLSGAGLMNDGAVLWMSVLINNIDLNGEPASNDNRTYVAFGAGDSDGFDRVGNNVGGGFTFALNKEFFLGDGVINVQAWNDGGQGAPSAVGATRGDVTAANVVAIGSTIFAVGKFTWGQFGVTDDRFELFLPDTNGALGSAISFLDADFDQLGAGAFATDAFDTISFSGGRSQNGTPEVDEIRFGASYTDVAPGLIPEPSAVALLGLGGLALMIRRRR